MKNLTLLMIFFAALFTTNLSADTYCTWDSWFKYPKNNQSYEAGKDVYVKVDPKNYRDIHYMELYVNGKFVRKESSYPYEWGRPHSSGDHQLRNMRAGKYKLEVRIKDKCGQWHKKYCIIIVKGHHNDPTSCHCEWDSYFKYPKSNGTYPKGKDVYVRVEPKNYRDIAMMELYLNGKFIRKETSYPFEWARPNSNGDHYLRNLHPGTYKLKVRIKDKCGRWHEKYCIFYVKGHDNGHGNGHGNGHDNGHCDIAAWFKYPKHNQSFHYGQQVYIRVDPKKYQDIAHMELYVDGKFVRKESQYPYEWGKTSSGPDYKLKRLYPGSHKIKVKIKDKCGHWKEIYCSIYIKRNSSS